NGGGTIFGCSQSPVGEPTLTVTGSEIAHAAVTPPVAYTVAPRNDRVTIVRPVSVLGLSEPLVLDSAQEPWVPAELSAPAPFLAAAPPLPPPTETVAA